MILDEEELETRAVRYLTKLVKQKIRNHRITYDYCKWNREWLTSTATTDSVLKFMFGLKDNEQEEIKYLRMLFEPLITRFLLSIRGDKTLMLKFFRFYMSLPVFKYEYKSKYHIRMEDVPPFQGSERTNTFMLRRCNFHFKDSYKNVEEFKLKKTMNEICDNGVINYGILSKVVVPLAVESDEIEQKLETYFLKSLKIRFSLP